MNSKYKLHHYPCGLRVGEKLKMIHPPVTNMAENTPDIEDDFWTVMSGSEDEPDVIWLMDDYGERSIWNEEEIFDQLERA